MKKTIGVFFGGISPEHEISVLTGVQAFCAIDTEKFNPIPVFVSQEGKFFTGPKLIDTKNYKDIDELLRACTPVSFAKENETVVMTSKSLVGYKKTQIDCAFLAFHGAYGEGGSFQGYCEILGLPYTSSNVLGSSLCMDKVSMKKILENEDIPQTRYKVFVKNDFEGKNNLIIAEVEKNFSYPVFVKPSNGGSSIGVSRSKNKEELLNAIEIAFLFDSKIIVEEEFTKDSEVNISYLGLWNDEINSSISEEVFSENQFLDFENKYLKGSKSKKGTDSKGMASTQRNMPAQIPNEILEKLINDGKRAFKLLHCGGVVRIDFLINKTTNNYVLVEVNTIPGSLSFYLWEKSGLNFSELTEKLINLAFKKSENQNKQPRKIRSQIFKNL